MVRSNEVFHRILGAIVDSLLAVVFSRRAVIGFCFCLVARDFLFFQKNGCDADTQLVLQLHQERTQVVCSSKEARKRPTESNGTLAIDTWNRSCSQVSFFFVWCFVATQLSYQLHQERTQVVCGSKEARKRLTDSNGTPAMDLVLGTDHRGMCVQSDFFLMPQHSQPSKYSRNAHKWCAVIRKEAQKRMTKSNGTSAMDLGHDCFDMMHLYIGRGFGKWNGMVSIMIIIIILLCCVLVFFSILSFPPLFLFLLLECIKCVCG